jgi:hypothetical protein
VKEYVFLAVENKMDDRDLMNPRSNLDRSFLDEQQDFNEIKGYPSF